jgi:hypothetical protein
LSALVPTAGRHVRPLHITYAKLHGKTIREFKKLSEDWLIHDAFAFISFEKLSRADSANFLEDLNPDVILCDESHGFKAPRSGRSKRMSRFLKEHPDSRFVPLTGTPGDDSLQNVGHIQEWVHNEHSPVPRTYNELTQWCQALDAAVTVRRAPGVLQEFLSNDTGPTLESVRRAVGLRIEQTPGNVFHRNTNEVSCSLYLDAVEVNERMPQVVDDCIAYVRQHETAPDGREFEEIQVHNALTTIPLGFYRVFEKKAPEEWSVRRKQYRAYIGNILSQSKYGLDTPDQVGRLCHQKKLDSGGIYERWKEIEPTFKSKTVCEWFDDTALDFACEWLHEHEGVIWTPFPEFGKLLAEKTNRLFFHEQGLARTQNGKLSIEDFPGKTGCILSTQANYLGRNLQDRYSKFLVFAPSAKSDVLEQLIGRFHRQGQQADQVEGTFFLGCLEHYTALMKARNARAEYDRDMNRNESCKLLTCDWLVPDWSEVDRWTGPRWHK